MKYLLLFIPMVSFGQLPDTIYFKLLPGQTTGVSESLYVVYESKTLPNTLIYNETPIDKAMTADEVGEYVFNLIYRTENANWIDEARIQQRIKTNDLFPVVNKIMIDLTNQGYYITARQKFIQNLMGVYIVRTPLKSNEYFLIRQNGSVAQCDENGAVITGGKTGQVQILTENRLRITQYFGDTQTFNKEMDTPFFFSNINKIRKIKSL